jgi:hypothetical protein
MVIVPVRTMSIPVAVTVPVPVSVTMTMAVSGKCCWRDQQRGSGSGDKEKFANH